MLKFVSSKRLKKMISIKSMVVIILLVMIPLSGYGKEIFKWDCESLSIGKLNNGTQNQPFDDVNRYAGIITEISNKYAHSGEKSIKLGYPHNEAGVELQVNDLGSTKSLYTRKYEYFETGWEKNWPVGLKTSRYFTGNDSSYAYMSEKLIWQSYDSSCNEEYGMGMNNAIGNKDLVDWYQSSELFKNNRPYIRTGHWYKFETWMVLNSAVDVPDGILKVWIDDVLVYSNESLSWKETSRGRINGEGWTRMWFGGNYSGAICGNPSTTLYRYIDDLYVSTTLDRPTTCTLSSKFTKATLSDGLVYYNDRDYILARVPVAYTGMEVITTPNDDRNLTTESDYLTFGMPAAGTVYVAYDSRATSLPGWLDGFIDTGDVLLTSLSSQPSLKIYSKAYAQGECVNFGANKGSGFSGGTVSNYIVLYSADTNCSPLAEIFTETTLDEGLAYYTDRDYVLTSVPSAYAGMDAIIAPNKDRNLTTESDYLTFEMPSADTVYVAYDSRATSQPEWMNGFIDTGDVLLTSLYSQPSLKIYSKAYEQGECVNFGANKASGFTGDIISNYIVFLNSAPGEPKGPTLID